MAHHLPAAGNSQKETSLADTDHIYFMNLVREQKQTYILPNTVHTYTHTRL